MTTASLNRLASTETGRARGWFRLGEHAKEMGALAGSRSTPAKARAARRNARRKRRLRALFTSRSEEWATPADTFRELDAEFGPFRPGGAA